MSKDAPEAPDYAAAAEKQGQSSREVTEQQTWANRPTINTPFGQQTWESTPTWDPSTGQYINSWTQNTNLTPEAQAALDDQMDIQQGKSNLALGKMGQVADEYGQPMDWDHFQSLQGSGDPNSVNTSLDRSGLQNVDSSEKYRSDAENAIYGKFASRMDPQFEREQDRKRTQLYNAGLKEGDEAYDQAMKELSQNQGDQREQATYQSIIGSGAEAQRMQGMDSSLRSQQFGEEQAAGTFGNQAAGQKFNQENQSANLNNQLRQQQIAEAMQKRGFSLNEMNAILNGQQVGMPSMPGFSNANASQAVQYNQAAQSQGQADLDRYNAQQQATQGMMSGIAGGAMMFSDRRLKTDIKPMFKDTNGVQWYKYRYLWDKVVRLGVMADEVRHIPGAVHAHFSGYDMVNYGAL